MRLSALLACIACSTLVACETAAPSDAAIDGGVDASSQDASSHDATVRDAFASIDATTSDSGTADAGGDAPTSDAGSDAPTLDAGNDGGTDAGSDGGSDAGFDADLAPCGNGVLELSRGEQCDDGNTISGDGCSSTCTFEADYIPETEPNDTISTANALGTHAGFVASINPGGNGDSFSFVVSTAGSSVFVRTSDGIGGCPAGFGAMVLLFSPSRALLATSNGGCASILPWSAAGATNLGAGTYGVQVLSATPQPEYVVTIDVRPVGCGDGVLEAGEQCDDGNSTLGDGCDATCMAESPWEIEPNDTRATATPLWPGSTSWNARIRPIGDHDYFTLTLTTSGPLTATTHDIGALAACSGDTLLHLLDHSGTQLYQDDDSGPGACSSITEAALSAGTYYLWVDQVGDSELIDGYALDVSF